MKQLTLFDDFDDIPPDDSHAGEQEENGKEEILEAAQSLARRIQDRCDVPIHLTVTDNRKNMISKRRHRYSACRLRVHHMFLDADDRIVDALADYVCNRGNPVDVLRNHIRDHRHLINPSNSRPAPRKEAPLRPVGEKIDLREIHTLVNKAYFDGASSADVTWGAGRVRLGAKKMSFASYNAKRNLITFSQRLNGKNVPQYVLEFLMYHEILHEVLGMRKGPRGRRQIHTAEFRQKEKAFPRYEEAVSFLDKVASGPGYVP